MALGVLILKHIRVLVPLASDVRNKENLVSLPNKDA